MGRMTIGALLLGVGLAIGLLWSGSGWGQPKIPPDFTFDQGKDSPETVTFSHEKHKEKVEKCVACHTKLFKMKKGQTGPLTMAKMEAGEQCGACHNAKTQMGGKVVFAVNDAANCQKCHTK